MDANWWNNALQSYDVGRQHRADRENAQAFQEGGYGAVEQAAGARGDLPTAMTTRRFQDDRMQQAYQRMEQIRPLALGALDRVGQLPVEQRLQFLNQPHIRQRFIDWGITPEQYDQASQQIANPETGQEALASYRAAFSQHQDPNWTLQTLPTEGGGYEQRAVGIGGDGTVEMGPNAIPGAGGAGRYATPDEVAQAGYRPGSVVWLVPGQPPRVVQAPNAGRSPTDPGSYPDDGYDYVEE